VENNFSFSSQRKTPRIRTEEQEEKERKKRKGTKKLHMELLNAHSNKLVHRIM
jgi:hypothetical protein